MRGQPSAHSRLRQARAQAAGSWVLQEAGPRSLPECPEMQSSVLPTRINTRPYLSEIQNGHKINGVWDLHFIRTRRSSCIAHSRLQLRGKQRQREVCAAPGCSSRFWNPSLPQGASSAARAHPAQVPHSQLLPTALLSQVLLLFFFLISTNGRISQQLPCFQRVGPGRRQRFPF